MEKINEVIEEKKCNAFGVDDTVGPCSQVKKALDASTSLLDIFKFIKVTEFELDPIMTNWFWQVMVNNQCSHLTTLVLEWFGYEGEERTQKQLFLRMLKRNNIPFRELKSSDKEVEMYPSIKEEMSLLPHKGAVALSKWLVMEPNDIKMAMLRLNTKNADAIKRYYIKMEELVRLYAQYTTLFQQREKESMSKEIFDLKLMMEDMKLERRQDRMMLAESHNMLRNMGVEIKDIKSQNNELLNQNNDLLDQNNDLIENLEDVQSEIKDVKHRVVQVQTKLDISVEDRAPQPDKDRRKERFLFIKRNDPNYPYYTIRAQDVNAQKALKRQKDRYTEVTVLLNLACHPNTKTFYVRIKEDLKKKGVEFNVCEISVENSKVTEEELIKAMMKINDEKRDIVL